MSLAASVSSLGLGSGVPEGARLGQGEGKPSGPGYPYRELRPCPCRHLAEWTRKEHAISGMRLAECATRQYRNIIGAGSMNFKAILGLSRSESLQRDISQHSRRAPRVRTRAAYGDGNFEVTG
jgi:hypothetical protein